MRKAYLGYLTWSASSRPLIDGIATGSIYAALALALVLIYRSTGIVNFAQGEMAMFSTFIAWSLTEAGLPVGLAILLTLARLARSAACSSSGC